MHKKNYSGYFIKPHFPDSESDYYQEDEIAGHYHKKNVKREFNWPEHPLGKIIMKTNNLGFRNDMDVNTEKKVGTKRILITGDSHTDGVLYNAESVATKLDIYLQDSYPGQNFQSLNAGNGYYGPQNYLGVLKKFLPLKPDAFVVIIYTGNDYLDGVRIESENGRLTTPQRPNDYFDKLWEVDGLFSGFTGQYLNQVKFFNTFPEYADTALAIMTENLTKIQNICEKKDIQLLVALLPTKLDTEPETDQDRINEVFKIMNFNEKQVQENQLLSVTLALWMDEVGISYFDLYEAFVNSSDELFWRADYHINHLGHDLIAKEITNSSVFDF